MYSNLQNADSEDEVQVLHSKIHTRMSKEFVSSNTVAGKEVVRLLASHQGSIICRCCSNAAACLDSEHHLDMHLTPGCV
jgi:hypothetical protein